MGWDMAERVTGTIPGQLLAALERYEKQGMRTGGFLYAVLCNDLMEAVNRADPEGLAALRDICLYVYNEMPSPSHGSKEAVEAWIEKTATEAKAEPV